jgi:hypothetical protein
VGAGQALFRAGFTPPPTAVGDMVEEVPARHKGQGVTAPQGSGVDTSSDMEISRMESSRYLPLGDLVYSSTVHSTAQRRQSCKQLTAGGGSAVPVRTYVTRSRHEPLQY